MIAKARKISRCMLMGFFALEVCNKSTAITIDLFIIYLAISPCLNIIVVDKRDMRSDNGDKNS